MKKGMKIALLGLMIWLIGFVVGGVGFVVFDIHEEALSDVLLIGAIKSLFLVIGWGLALFLVFRDKGQNYIHMAWKAGIAWYAIILLLDLIVLVGLLGLEFDTWLPSIFTYSMVAIITIVVGYLLAGPKPKSLD